MFPSAFVVYDNSYEGEFVFDDLHAIRDNADVDASKTTIATLFANNFWGRNMKAINVQHQVGDIDCKRLWLRLGSSPRVDRSIKVYSTYK